MGIVHCIGSPPYSFRKIGYTKATIIHQVAVSLEHAIPCVFLGCINDFICCGFYPLIFLYILWPPTSRL